MTGQDFVALCLRVSQILEPYFVTKRKESVSREWRGSRGAGPVRREER